MRNLIPKLVARRIDGFVDQIAGEAGASAQRSAAT